MLLVLRGERSHFLFLFIHLSEQLVDIVYELEAIHDVVFDFEMDSQFPNTSFLYFKLVTIFCGYLLEIKDDIFALSFFGDNLYF
jgi:hypothetical protein